MRLCILLAALMAARGDGEEYWRFKAGTEWVYESTEGKEKSKVVMKVTKAGASAAETRDPIEIELKEFTPAK